MTVHLPVQPRPYLMHNQIQPYTWGTRDAEAFIPRLLGVPPQAGVPYAELWMGAHPKAPSSIVLNEASVPLDHWIAAHPVETLGQAVARQFDGALPFLFKVLSAGEALSIQAHPNKAQAEVLHARDPEHYPDDNHKPEVGVALDSLTALIGIKPLGDLLDTLNHYPEIADFIGQEVCEKARQAPSANPRVPVQLLLATLFQRSVSQQNELAAAIDRLAMRLSDDGSVPTEAERLFLDLRRTYAGPDVGLFAIFVMNLVHLQAGQGMFVHAGVPHAYLKGNIVECMANSDNVVRVGLTPKFKDAQALIEIMDFEPKPVQVLGVGQLTNAEETVYTTPAPEFCVSRYHLKRNTARTTQTHGPQIVLLTQGEMVARWEGETPGELRLIRGQSIFIPALLPVYTLHAADETVFFTAEVPAKGGIAA